MWNWQDGLQAWGAMAALAVVLLVVITALAWYAHSHAAVDDDPDLTTELRG